MPRDPDWDDRDDHEFRDDRDHDRDRDDDRDDDWDDDRDPRRRRFEFPDDPDIGDRAYNGDIVYAWDGRKWTRASAGRRHERPVIAVMRRPPEHPVSGTMWYHPREHKLAIWIGRWVPVGGDGNFLSLHERPHDSDEPWRVHGNVRFERDVKVRRELLVDTFTLRQGWADEDEHRDHDRDHHDRDRHDER